MNELHLFAGAGGGILGGMLLGHRTVCAVEIEPYCRKVLLQRQRDGILPWFPIWDDVRTFDGKPWRGIADVVCGGFPCQDISCAGSGKGIEGEKSGLWGEMARIIGEVRPRYAFIENSPMLIIRGLDRVLCDLAEMGYSARWGIVGAADMGAPHKRDRVWIVAYAEREQTDEKRKTCERGRDSMGWHKQAAFCENRQAGTDCIIGQGDHVADSNGMRELQPQRSFCDEQRRVSDGSEEMADTDRTGRKEQRCPVTIGTEHEAFKCRGWWAAEPAVGRMAYGVASRVDRLRCLGNGQVPIVAASAWRILMDT